MKQLMHVYAKTAQDLCKMVNQLGVEPVAVLPAGSGQRVVAYYYGAAPKAEAKKPEPAKAEPSEAPKAEAKKPVASAKK